jgi:hypothetical protein
LRVGRGSLGDNAIQQRCLWDALRGEEEEYVEKHEDS